MTNHFVTLKAIPCLHIECKFWLRDDGYGTSEHPSITPAGWDLALLHRPPLRTRLTD
jgi:hypothetical protein